MQCPNCGGINPDDGVYCSTCGAVLHPQPTARVPLEPIQNYLVWAILTTIFCCLPFGVVSIVYAAQVDGKVAAGDFIGARESSRNAKKWALVSLFCWLAAAMVVCLFYGAVIVGAGIKAGPR